MLLRPIPLIYRKRSRPIRRAPRVVPPVAPLMLVAATYDADGPKATLTFDRAVNVSAFEGSAINVNDPVSAAATFEGSGGAVLVSPAVIDVMLTPIDLPSGTVVTMSATALTGIVAADDGGTWAGVADLELPFP